MIRAAVLGATGYAGAELVRILVRHPDVELSMITSRGHAGKAFSEIYPAMKGVTELICQHYDEEAAANLSDVVFTALPHKAAMGVVPGLIERNLKVIDLSADFRFKNAATYEAWYESHEAKNLLPKAVYGLAEVYADEIRKASLVGNPGCYPTSFLLAVLPLVNAPFTELDGIIADSKSGTSGAGRSPNQATQFCEVNEAFKAYKVGEHRHTPEMEEVLSRFAGRPLRITFTPHLVPMTRGMLTTVYLTLKQAISEDAVIDRLKTFYAGKPFVRICPRGQFPNTMYVRGTNFCDLGVKVVERSNRLILISAIDNLVKGASGQAVQNMNLMFGLPERAGLDLPPMPV